MTPQEADLRTAYLDLIGAVIINEIYKDPPLRRTLVQKIRRAFGGHATHSRAKEFNAQKREVGQDFPSVAHSMIGRKRMANLRARCSDAIERGIPGDFIETGVWRGGACIYMRAILKAYGDTERKVWVADSFAGLPPPDTSVHSYDKGDRHYKVPVLAVSLEEVQNNFRVYGLLDDQVQFLKGWFSETLPTAPIDKLAVLRLDGDMYDSTMDAMKALYHKVSIGGTVIVDDYHAVPACRKAVHDFLETHAPDDIADIQEIDGTGVWWERRLKTA
ncbi:TylF/MycF family methyltransferase [Roseibaca sp. Y0-43]|uniref:TylF/MycF family methyltransferase n=1 Tax=Roseibaca sp. Y0-43 TaxID=2816854 RepID=UPI001D0C2B03|nr:TylF/MycF family methyltransferase [Roseibaca sp. Y0-43]MCC1480603.1 TylF/MycF family methyltransferase [Roseibaca sp. Y0-43]